MITLTVTQDEVVLIGKALTELPFKISAPLIMKLQSQVDAQLKQPEPEKAE